MKQFYKILISSLLFLVSVPYILDAQTTIKGKVRDAESGEDLIGATIALQGVSGGTLANYEGEFFLKVESLPVTLRISYTGYQNQ